MQNISELSYYLKNAENLPEIVIPDAVRDAKLQALQKAQYSPAFDGFSAGHKFV